MKIVNNNYGILHRVYSLSSGSPSMSDVLEVGKFILVFTHSFIHTFIKHLLGTNYELSPKTTGMKDLSFFPYEGAQNPAEEMI